MYKDDPVKEPTSYFQIAGIHGLPYKSWNDVTPEKTYNYCEHSTVLFPTWHRAYLVLFEVRCPAWQSKTHHRFAVCLQQRVQQHAAEIAKGYTGIDKDLWAQAAADIRQPFWDWARPGGRVPPKQIISDPRVDITLPSGKDSVENPFLAFTFPNGTFSGKTLRAPIAGSNSIEKLVVFQLSTMS
jgi:tyrosinase